MRKAIIDLFMNWRVNPGKRDDFVPFLKLLAWVMGFIVAFVLLFSMEVRKWNR